MFCRPNKIGQTPYSIDQMNPSPILPHIFGLFIILELAVKIEMRECMKCFKSTRFFTGPIDAENQMESILGYDVYSNVLADMVRFTLFSNFDSLFWYWWIECKTPIVCRYASPVWPFRSPWVSTPNGAVERVCCWANWGLVSENQFFLYCRDTVTRMSGIDDVVLSIVEGLTQIAMVSELSIFELTVKNTVYSGHGGSWSISLSSFSSLLFRSLQ